MKSGKKQPGKIPFLKVANDFYEAVYDVVYQIPVGRVTTYGAIAAYLGSASASRMVGYALNNSFGLQDLPAHRVVNRLGQLTGQHHFPPDRPMKAQLEAEGILIENDRIANFQRHLWDPRQELPPRDPVGHG